MPAYRFFCPTLGPGLNTLPADEIHHAVSVMRCRAGDRVELIDGRGQVAEGLVEAATKREVKVRVEQTRSVSFEFATALTLAVAMCKTHRHGYLIEKCTELGAAAIWAILAERSVTRPGEAAVEKWSRRAIEAAKQSGRAWVPVIAPVVPFAEAVARAGEFSGAFFCDLGSDAVSFRSALDNLQSANSIIAFVGPEGGWSDEERKLAHEAGLTRVSLSPTILRAETAAVATCAAIAAQSVGGCVGPGSSF